MPESKLLHIPQNSYSAEDCMDSDSESDIESLDEENLFSIAKHFESNSTRRKIGEQESRTSQCNFSYETETEIYYCAKDLPSEALQPRSRTPLFRSNESLEEISNCSDDMDAKLNPVTPTKPVETEEVDPLTPTANLKMLISAASPEIRNREKQKAMERQHHEIGELENMNDGKTSSLDCLEDIDEDVENEAELGSSQKPVSRKEKSLGLLCQRYMLL